MEKEVVLMRVGGELFAPLKSTLTKSESMLRVLVDGKWDAIQENGEIIIDRPAVRFRRLLYALQYDEIPFSYEECKELMEEADFFSLSSLTETIQKVFPLLGTMVRINHSILYACRFAVPSDGPPPFENCLLAIRFDVSGKYEFFQTEEKDEFWVKDFEGQAKVHPEFVSLDYKKDSQLFVFHLFHSPVDQSLVLQAEPLFGCLIADSKALTERIAYTKSDFI